MICKDMKYTALYWALRFIETDLDIHTKNYDGYKITIYAEKQKVDYGDKIKCGYNELSRHKDFVVLECIDRLLSNGYKPESIQLFTNDYDILITLENNKKMAIYCEQWGEDYTNAVNNEITDKYDYNVLYTSRLVSGLLEYKNKINKIYSHGIFDSNKKTDFILTKELAPSVEQTNDIDDFDIFEDELLFYHGKKKIVKVPEGITTISASAFWNNTYIEKVILPQSLKRIGGDSFYYCKNLNSICIPKDVWIMGNNPFSGCPKLKLENCSPNFILDDGVLYNKDKTNIIYYEISKKDREYLIPNTVECIGKHCFFGCSNLEKIIIPESVIRLENNPFSGCEKLSVENHSQYYIFENGVIYNKYKSMIVGCLNGTEIEKLVVPETVSLISRNSFWHCNGIKKIVITKNVDRIGYNPFASCTNLLIEGNSNSNFIFIDGLIYDLSETHLLCATDKAVGKNIKIKDSVTHINRGVFSGCKSLENVDLNNVTYIDKSSFTNCIGLTEIYIPDNVTYIGEWTFSYCTNLKKISINKKTTVDKNAFNECPAEIELR